MSSENLVHADVPFDPIGFEKAVTLIKSLDNRNRLLIFCLLCDRNLNVTEMAEAAGLSLSAASQHLAVLKTADLVETEKRGQTVLYRLKSDEVRQVVALLKTMYCNV